MGPMRQGRYIGVTGFMSNLEVVECLKVFTLPNILKQQELLLMIGVLVSSKTLSGRMSGGRTSRYPAMAAIPEILSCHNDLHALCTIHYNTREPETLEDQVAKVIDIGQGRVHAIQLNMRWPNPVTLQRIKRRWPELRLILQMGHKAIADVTDGERIYLRDAIFAYDGVDDFLFDPSGGLGMPLSIEVAMKYLDSAHVATPFGVAGGFCAENVHKLEPLFCQEGSILSIDAEGRLRTTKEEGDKLSIPAAQAYIVEALGVMSGFLASRR